MEKVLVGKYVKTHGIKGEIKIKSNFKYKDRVFKVGNLLFIGEKEFEITGYRIHQDYDMITLKGINDINEILPLKGSFVYFDKEKLNLDDKEYLDTDLINLDLYMKDRLIGKVQEISYITKTKKLLIVDNHYIPYELIKNIDFKSKKIEIEEVSGLI